jgi:DNA invertase Pin-like site-specific DNA recombinase
VGQPHSQSVWETLTPQRRRSVARLLTQPTLRRIWRPSRPEGTSDGRGSPAASGRLHAEKITREPQQRLAIVYIRQSTPQQVERNPESTKLQYALVDRAFHFDWARETIVTIDDDLGRSGSSIEGRLGFQRLAAEVGLGHGARSCRGWHQLLEICALFDTLIADVDGVYDPANYNDRLLLGLKGTMSEAELHILQARMVAGHAKARRGELGKPLPMGYLRRPSDEVALDPDEQVQGVICLAFDLFQWIRKVSRFCAISSRTASRCRCVRPGDRARANWNGAGPAGLR